MVIYLQNRKGLCRMPKEVWTTNWTVRNEEKGLIVCTGRNNPYMGTYATVERADEVLEEMFQYYRNGKKSYIMPEK